MSICKGINYLFYFNLDQICRREASKQMTAIIK